MRSGSVRIEWPDLADIVRVPRADGGVDIMLDGEVVDTIEPVRRTPTREENEEFLRRMHELSKKVTAQWRDPSVSAVDAVREQRRNVTPDEWIAPNECSPQ